MLIYNFSYIEIVYSKYIFVKKLVIFQSCKKITKQYFLFIQYARYCTVRSTLITEGKHNFEVSRYDKLKFKHN